MSPALVRAPAAALRIARARRWLLDRAPSEAVLVVAASAEAANELLRSAAAEKGAAFGWHRASLGRLASALAAPLLVEKGLAPIGTLASEAAVARVLHEMADRGSLGRYAPRGPELGRDAPRALGPGLARAFARTLAEVRLAGVDPAAMERLAPELRRVYEAYEEELERTRLADRARVLRLATEAASSRASRHPLLGLPTLLLDVPVENATERAFVAAICGAAPDLLATVPSGDERTCANLRDALAAQPEALAPGLDTPLGRLQTHLFEETAPPAEPIDESLLLLSAPGESRECVEIARRILDFAGGGVPFDRIGIFLRAPDEYRPHLEEALGRARIPFRFARGSVRPDPAGRALVALLACAAEGLSARRFAEYLSLGEVPDPTEEGAPPPAPPESDRWVAPDEELVPEAIAQALETRARPAEEEPLATDPDRRPVTAGTLRAPRRWERLLVDAAVIGGRDRWERRLGGLESELRVDLEALDDPDDPAGERIVRDLADLASLRGYALPLLEALDALPARARWGEWISHLSALAARSLRRPERVLSALAELAPMAEVGPVELGEVRLVLSARLLEVAVPPPPARYGAVFVGPAEAARGLGFDVVFVPGLAERLFPRKIAEDPILLDQARAGLDPGLATNEDRVARERTALRLAVGAAGSHVVLSYPRLELDPARPRVPSFYPLEALRAAEGRLPGFDELAKRAETVAEARVGWPAPSRPEHAIDEAEHDLALLESILRLDVERSVGTAHYLLTANPHLGRALRSRARRWLRRWTPADGLVEPSDGARGVMQSHALGARSYSPTALQQYATCPYRFFLYAVHRLAPREVPEAIEEMDPLQRGSLVHDVQFELFRRLAAERLLPVTGDRLDRARELLDDALGDVAARYHDDLAPAIERVWEDGIESVRADLREWLRRSSEDSSGFVPWRFELSFGLPGRRIRDPSSTEEPVTLDCGIRLRGAIDLVERRPDELLRATDHKTGRERLKPGEVVSGGESLQPVLYALALEKLFPEARVESGRLYYCTAAGGFEARTVPLDGAARRSAETVAEILGEALSTPFLPAAPARDACRWCDYRVVCGPYEELRTARKPRGGIASLARLRGLR